MPNRLVREGFLDSEAIDKLSPDAECFYHRLLLVADDAGRVDARLDIIRARTYPLRYSLRNNAIAGWIRECIRSGLCLAYDAKGKPFLQLTRWQRCGNGKSSRYPWSDGSFVIEYVTLETRDGPKEFVATSISHTDPIGIPSASHRTPRAPPSPSSSPSKPKKILMSESESDLDFLPESLRCEEFILAWERWKRHRDEIKKSLKPTQIAMQLEQFTKWGVDRSIRAIDYTITKGWQGIREPNGVVDHGYAEEDPRGNFAAAKRYMEKYGNEQGP